jgi:hypothetical protein
MKDGRRWSRAVAEVFAAPATPTPDAAATEPRGRPPGAAGAESLRGERQVHFPIRRGLCARRVGR